MSSIAEGSRFRKHQEMRDYLLALRMTFCEFYDCDTVSHAEDEAIGHLYRALGSLDATASYPSGDAAPSIRTDDRRSSPAIVSPITSIPRRFLCAHGNGSAVTGDLCWACAATKVVT